MVKIMNEFIKTHILPFTSITSYYVYKDVSGETFTSNKKAE